MNPGRTVKSNKHGLSEAKELINRPVHFFSLVEPDEVIQNYSPVNYKIAISNLLTNFDGALFLQNSSNPNVLEAHTDLTLRDIKTQQNTKMRINLDDLLLALDNEKQYHYKNLDDFKPVIEVEVKKLTLQQSHWAKVLLERDEKIPCYPQLVTWINLNEFTLKDFALCNIIDFPLYGSYLESITNQVPLLNVSRSITRSEGSRSYNDVYDVFYVDYSYIEDGFKPITTFKFNLDLYFSHLKYLQKVINTYN